jgi:hypothetical protein
MSILLDWYQSRLRPFIHAQAPGGFAQLDAIMAKARTGDGRYSEVRVGVVGEAGVGKSTLINALLSERLTILPQGGVGPLTATPIEIRHAIDPYVRVYCFGRTRIEELVAATVYDSTAPSIHGPDRTRLNTQRQMARLLVGASQFADLSRSDILRFLNACVGDVPGWQPSAIRDRVIAARAVVELGDSANPSLEIIAGLDLPGMLQLLMEHAAGFLAPLTAAIEIGWDSPMLHDGLVLVDLPGLGVANDHYRDRTSAALESLDAVLCVVDRAGLTQSCADLLHMTKILTRHVSAPTSLRPELLIAVTKLDQPAADAFLFSKLPGAQRLTWSEASVACANRARDVLQSQLALELSRAIGCDPISVDDLARRVLIFPVLPREYQRFHRADSEEPTRLVEVGASGVANLAANLSQVARAHQIDLVFSCHQALSRLMQGPARADVQRLDSELCDITSQMPTGSAS